MAYRGHLTPITHLTSAFSSTKMTSKTHDKPFRRHGSAMSPSESVLDIDECANLEPPMPTYSQFEFSNQYAMESSNSNSSGYFSSCSRSAPPTCKDYLSSQSQISFNVSADAPKPQSARTLSRTRSFGWLSKRKSNADKWPKIGKITRRTSLNAPTPLREPNMFTIDCNSAPPFLFGSEAANGVSNPRVSKPLSPVDECQFGQSEEAGSSSPKPPEAVSVVRDDFVLHSPSKAKRQRFSHESTLPLDDCLAPADLPALKSMSRHHSTPVASFSHAAAACRPSALETSRHSPVRQSSPKPYTRTFSVPVGQSADKLDNCMSSLDRNDGRSSSILPVCDRTSSGLSCVSADTVSDVLRGKYQKKKVEYLIVDCRYPYEYEGGHVDGAVNIYTHSELVYEIFNRVPAQRQHPGSQLHLGSLLQERLSRLDGTVNDFPNFDFSSSSEEDSLGDAENQSSLMGECPNEVEELHMDILQASMDQSRSRNPSAATGVTPDGPGSPILADSSLGSAKSASSPSNCDTSLSASSGEPNFIVILHCEFSSQRAPTLATFLRSIDRKSNFHRYPFLYFPELYIMKGGYSEFYQKHPSLCTPQRYTTMFDREYRSDLRLYRGLTKRVGQACLNCVRQHAVDIQAPALPLFDVARALRTATSLTPNAATQPASRPVLRRAQTAATTNTPLSLNVFCAEQPSPESSGRSSGLSGSPVLTSAGQELYKQSRTSQRMLFTHSTSDGEEEEEAADGTEHAALDLAESIVRVGRHVEASAMRRVSLNARMAKVDLNASASEPVAKRAPPATKAKKNLFCPAVAGCQTPSQVGTPVLGRQPQKAFKNALLGFSTCSQPGTPVEATKRPLGTRDLNVSDWMQ